MTDLSTPRGRLADAISGERRLWHKVEVRPDDIAALLASTSPCGDCGGDGWHDPQCQAAVLPLGEPPMHAHGGLGIHDAREHHR